MTACPVAIKCETSECDIDRRSAWESTRGSSPVAIAGDVANDPPGFPPAPTAAAVAASCARSWSWLTSLSRPWGMTPLMKAAPSSALVARSNQSFS